MEKRHTVHSVSSFFGFAALLLMRTPVLLPVLPLPIAAIVAALMAIAVGVAGTTWLTPALRALVLGLLSRTPTSGRDRYPDQLLDVAQERGLFRIAKRNRHAFGSSASRAADPVHVRLRHVW